MGRACWWGQVQVSLHVTDEVVSRPALVLRHEQLHRRERWHWDHIARRKSLVTVLLPSVHLGWLGCRQRDIVLRRDAAAEHVSATSVSASDSLEANEANMDLEGEHSKNIRSSRIDAKHRAMTTVHPAATISLLFFF